MSGNVFAGSLSMSPTQINFIGSTNEKICNEITIKTEGSKNLIGEDRWAEKGETRRKFLIHNLSSNDLGLGLNYNEIITILNKTNLEICLEGKNSGNYHGLLLYRIDSNPTGVGIWMNVSLTNENSFTKFTGKVIGETKEKSKINLALTGSLILTTIFFFLIFRLRYGGRKKKNSSNQ